MNNQTPAEKRINELKKKQREIDMKLAPGVDVFMQVIKAEEVKSRDVKTYMDNYDRTKDPDGSALYGELKGREHYTVLLQKLEGLLIRASKRGVNLEDITKGDNE